ncbi:MAG: zinc-dependent alcohol dehydrogenase family protein [Deltaproteobacteria bacterium]|nr:zinc-dependent alcohol dehydrogenase family protein [Deltaproteobacteria bacterium]
MKAMILDGTYDLRITKNPLKLAEVPVPEPQDDEVLIKVSACGVCHTEIDEIEGRAKPKKFPIIPGHQIVGRIEKIGKKVKNLKVGDRVGVGWINSACGNCKYCLEGRENLCDFFVATGKDVDGGYAEYTKVKEEYAFRIPETFADYEACPLLCAGAIGYRSLRLANPKNGDTIGLIGFGASNHLVIQMITFLYPASRVFVFARSESERNFSLELGAFWAGDIDEKPPEKLNVAIDTTPVWRPVIYGLKNLAKGGRLVINAIRKEDKDRSELLKLSYEEHLWHEKEIKSVANVSVADIKEFLDLADRIRIKPEFQVYPLVEANQVIIDIVEKKIRGAKVLAVE